MKRSKLLILLCGLLAFAMLFTACGGSDGDTQDGGQQQEDRNNNGDDDKEPPEDLLDAVKARGELIIGTEGTWAPWTYHDEDDNLVGYDVEVAALIAEKLGVEANFVEGKWDGLLIGLESGRYDMMANGVDVTEEREEKYDFSEPYAYNRTALIVAADNDEIKTFEDLNGKTTANTISSTYATLAESYGASPIGVDDLNQTLELLMAGRIDATLNSEVTFYDYMKAHPDAPIKIAALTEEATTVALPMPKGEGSDSLREAVNQAIAELREAGTLSELSEKYFGTDISNN